MTAPLDVTGAFSYAGRPSPKSWSRAAVGSGRSRGAVCVEVGLADGDVVLDSAGPSRWTFEAFVRLMARAIGSRAWIGRAPPEIALAASRVAGFALRDVLLTRDEMGALMAGLIVSSEEPRGSDRFDAWLAENAPRVGRRYTSELARNFG